jgi:hypothetical protein
MTARRVKDENGTEWLVYEVALPEPLLSTKHSRHPLNLPAAWLCFESATQRRRLSPVPEGWQGASAEELRRLLTLARKPGEPVQLPPTSSDSP